MDNAHILALAVGSWMQYEFACGRSTLFSERYISVPIANALYRIYGKQVWAEYEHPVLAGAMTGPGRRPQVDFAVVDKYPAAVCVVESKWVGSNGIDAEDILWDLIRLELTAHYTNAEAYFVLAGRRRNLVDFFSSKAFLGTPDASGKYKRLLKLGTYRNARIRIDNPAKSRIEPLRRLISPYQDLSFASRLTTSVGYSFPEQPPNYQYQAFAWRVIAPPGTARFFPKNHKMYATAPKKSENGAKSEGNGA